MKVKLRKPYSAVYGVAGFMNAVTRSGSNVFHCSAFYYNRISALATTPANLSLFSSANFGPGNFAALREVSPSCLPHVLQFARFTFWMGHSGVEPNL